MSSRIARFSSDDIDRLSNGFRKMGREFKSSHGSNHNELFYNSDDDVTQEGWDDFEEDGEHGGNDDDGDDELKEEDVWAMHSTNDHSFDEKGNSGSPFRSAAENGCTTGGSKVRKSWLSMELQMVGSTGQKKECVGVGFAALEAVQKGGKDSNGGWAPGFSTRKVKIPHHGGGSGYGNGWHAGGNHAGVPQSAPVSMAVWPAKCLFGTTAGGADVEGSTGGDGGNHDEDSDVDDDDDNDDDKRGGRLAPHEIVDREYARSQSTTFSVIEGAGRTLKGMDLRRVRNAVWSRMGFED